MSEHNSGFDGLAEAWQKSEPAPTEESGFAAELKRRRRSTLLVVAIEAILTAVLVWVTVTRVAGSLVDGDVLVLSGLWLFWTVATAFAWWNRRGQWDTVTVSTEAFVHLSLDRAHRKIRVVWFALGLVVAQLIFAGVLIGTGSLRGLGGSPAIQAAVFGSIAVPYLIWCVWYYRRARNEKAYYRKLLEEMAGPVPSPPAAEAPSSTPEQ